MVVLIRAIMPDGRCVQVQAYTSVVSAHGGLLESPVQLATNQNIRLINPHAGEEVGCRVVRVEGPTLALYEVAFEFDEHTPQFWQINFPPDDWLVKETSNYHR